VDAVAIVGTGLIGSSFGLALRAAGFQGEILGVSSPGAIEAATRAGAIDRGTSLKQAAGAARLIFLARPVFGIIETLAKLDAIVNPEALITDAGSTKVAIMAAAKQHLTRARFIGGHPMAGSEKTGAAAADANLFRGRPWVLTPADADAAELTVWLENFGAEVIRLDAAAHDRMVAFTSHLPQLTSTALAVAVSNARRINDTAIFGPGLLDMTRLARSSWEVWRDILFTNQDAVLQALEEYSAELARIRQQVESGDEIRLKSLFQQAQQFAEELRARPREDTT